MFSFFNVQAVPSLYDDEDVTGEQVEIFGIMMSTIKKANIISLFAVYGSVWFYLAF